MKKLTKAKKVELIAEEIKRIRWGATCQDLAARLPFSSRVVAGVLKSYSKEVAKASGAYSVEYVAPFNRASHRGCVSHNGRARYEPSSFSVVWTAPEARA